MKQNIYLFQIILYLLCVTNVNSSTTYHVATNGSDAKSGTVSKPFKTIQHAADIMQPGDRCVVHAGTYREWVKPPRGGESKTRCITYKAAKGEQVIIKGSEQVGGWIKQGKVWQLELTDSFFKGLNPFKRKLQNQALYLHSQALYYGMEYHLGEVFLNGVSLKEKLIREEVITTPLSMYIDDAVSNTVIVANFGDINPNSEITEISARECIFFPTEKRLKFITLNGFTFSQAAPKWTYWNAPQEAAVGTNFGYGWIITNCKFTDIRCVALVCGNETYKRVEGTEIAGIGNHIVKNNYFARCGEAAIHGNWGWFGSLIEGNLIEDINTKNEFGGLESSGIKIHYAIDLTVKNNIIRRVYGHKPIGLTKPCDFAGIWIDWAAQGTRVTGNIVYDTEVEPLFLQNSHGSPLLVDNNILSGNIRCSSEGVVFTHNLFVNSKWFIKKGDYVPYWLPHSGNRINVAVVPRANIKWWNNIFIGRGLDSTSVDTGFVSNWNFFYNGARKSQWDDTRSVENSLNNNIKFKDLANGVEITLNAENELLQLKPPLVNTKFVGIYKLTNQAMVDKMGNPISIISDIFQNRRNEKQPVVGPIESIRDGENIFKFVGGTFIK